MDQRPEFERLEASLLLCPHCRVAQPVRRRLLLVLPEGDKIEYLCKTCGASCGDGFNKAPPVAGILSR